MPKRPRSHELEETSRNRLHEIFTQTGWVVWDLQPDYGEDLLVRIFVNNTATHYSFFVQAKATNHIERYMDKDKKFISFPIDTDHIEHWGQFWEPVILTVWDAKSNITYWESIQKYLEEQAGNESKRKSIRVAIPTRNVLDNDGVKRIARYTKSRYILNEQEHEGIDTLIELLEEALKAKIEYYPKRGIIFIDYVNGRATHTFFGSNNPLLDLIEQHPEEHYQKMLLKTVNELAKIKQELKETGKITLQDENGIIVETYETFEDYIQHITENNDKKIYGFE